MANLYRIRGRGDLDPRVGELEVQIAATTAAVAVKRYLDTRGTKQTVRGTYRAPLRLRPGETVTLEVERLR